MKENLGFADAAAIVYRTRGSSGEYTIVVGVEDSTPGALPADRH